MQRHFLIALIATMLTFAGTTALAANNPERNNAANDTYSAMDVNNDGRVSEREFREYYIESGIYELWDVDDDGWIDEEEFGDGLYTYYDDNEDGFISDAEWEAGILVDDYGEGGFWDI